MSSIPFPNIAQEAGEIAATPQNALAEYARMAQLKQQTASLQQQQQQQAATFPAEQSMREQQAKAAEMQNAQTEAVNLAYQGAFKPDLNGQPQLDTEGLQRHLAESGHGTAIPSIMEGITKYKDAQGKLEKQQQDLQTSAHDAMGNLGFALQQANYDPQLAHTIIQDHMNDPGLTPQMKAQIQQEQQAIAQNPALIKQFADQWVSQSPAQQEREVKRQKEANDEWKATGNGQLINVRSGEVKGVESLPAQEREFQAFYKNKLAATGAQPSARAEFDSRREFALLHRAPRNDQASQDAIEAAAQSIAKMDPKDLTRLKDIASLRGDQRLLIYNRAKQINPNFSTAEVDRKAKMLDSFTNGKDAQQLQSFGTFLEHAGEASRVTNHFRTTSLPLVNTPVNAIRSKFGDDSYSQFVAALEPVRKEFEGFLLGGRALYGDDRKAAETILSDSASPAQIQAALKQMGHTVKARQNEIGQRFKNQMGAGLEEVLGPMSPEALEGAKQIGIDMGASKNRGTAADPQGGHVIRIGQKRYQYKGSGDTADLSNYTELQ